jgi:seryl-tRNA synthetase
MTLVELKVKTQDLKRKLQEAEREHDRAAGALNAVMERFREFECSTVEEARKRCNDLTDQIATIEQEKHTLETDIETMLKQHAG